MNNVILIGKITSIGLNTISILPTAHNDNNMSIDIEVPDMIYENLISVCNEGDVVGVKGYLQVEFGRIIIIGEKISFLSANNRRED